MTGIAAQATTEEQMVQRMQALTATVKQPRVVMSGNHATPWDMVTLVDNALPEYKLSMLNAGKQLTWREGVVHETSFVGPGMRKSPGLSYVPSRLSMVPQLYRTALIPDIVILHTSAPVGGKVSMGIEVNVLPAAVEACRRRGGLVFAQINQNMPYTYGDGEIELASLDGYLERDVPIATAKAQTPGTVDAAAARIGELAASRVHSGATMQMGIGAVPDAVLAGLVKLRGLGIWTEMFSDGLLDLLRNDALDPNRFVVASFAMGSPELMDWMHENPQLKMLRTETTNGVTNISQQPAMTSINTALQVDLFDQANASRRNARIHSGFGGQTDFFVGAMHSIGGQAMMALRSWHPKADVSTIVPLCDEPVTSFQHTAVITEQGVAELLGRSQREQAEAIIHNAAHPDVRDELVEEGRDLGLL